MESSESMLESINHGANQCNLSQIFPMSGNVQNARVGSGNASGRTVFQWAESAAWWSPINSYFYIRLQFQKAGDTIGATDYTTYCDNFIMTLFNSVQIQVGDQPLELVNTPWIVDTALTYSKAENNFLKTWGSLTRIGESLATRMTNVTINKGYVDVVFRPPLALFDVATLPPGVQFQVFFNWNPSEQLAWESLVVNPVPLGTAANQYSITVQSFSYYKASITMDPSVPLKEQFAIDLWPATATQYPFVNNSSIQQNIQLPSTTNKILIVFQDTQQTTIASAGTPLTIATSTGQLTGVGGGYNPATSFTNLFTTAGSTAQNAVTQLIQLWLQIPEIGYTGPKPQYVFDTNFGDMYRAYSDWAHGTQGTCLNSEGSVPYGNCTFTGVPIMWINSASGGAETSVFQLGDPANNQAMAVVGVGTVLPTATTFSQTSRWGWSGRVPGPIFCFTVVRPDDRTVSVGTLYAQFGASVPASVTSTVIAQYNTILSFEHAGAGLYRYKFYS